MELDRFRSYRVRKPLPSSGVFRKKTPHFTYLETGTSTAEPAESPHSEFLCLNEGKQVGVDLFRVCCWHAMRQARIEFRLGILEQLG